MEKGINFITLSLSTDILGTPMLVLICSSYVYNNITMQASYAIMV